MVRANGTGRRRGRDDGRNTEARQGGRVSDCHIARRRRPYHGQKKAVDEPHLEKRLATTDGKQTKGGKDYASSACSKCKGSNYNTLHIANAIKSPSCLKWLSLLATSVLTLIIVSLPGFEFWHWAPLWGGGGFTIIMAWQRMHSVKIEPEMETVLRYERMRMLHLLLNKLIVMTLLMTIIAVIFVLTILSLNPLALDKVLDFVLELVRLLAGS